jgi:hypothetical protein
VLLLRSLLFCSSCFGVLLRGFVVATSCVRDSQIQERVRKKGRAQFNKSKTGSIVAFKVSFREWDSLTCCSHVCISLFATSKDQRWSVLMIPTAHRILW